MSVTVATGPRATAPDRCSQPGSSGRGCLPQPLNVTCVTRFVGLSCGFVVELRDSNPGLDQVNAADRLDRTLESCVVWRPPQRGFHVPCAENGDIPSSKQPAGCYHPARIIPD